MGAVALDASVAIALFSATDAHHQRARAELDAVLARGDSLILPASAYSEIMVHALRNERGELIDRFVDRLRVKVVPADREVSRRAAELRAAHRSLRLPDALVVATAQLRGAELLTFDERLLRL